MNNDVFVFLFHKLIQMFWLGWGWRTIDTNRHLVSPQKLMFLDEVIYLHHILNLLHLFLNTCITS